VWASNRLYVLWHLYYLPDASSIDSMHPHADTTLCCNSKMVFRELTGLCRTYIGSLRWYIHNHILDTNFFFLLFRINTGYRMECAVKMFTTGKGETEFLIPLHDDIRTGNLNFSVLIQGVHMRCEQSYGNIAHHLKDIVPTKCSWILCMFSFIICATWVSKPCNPQHWVLKMASQLEKA